MKINGLSIESRWKVAHTELGNLALLDNLRRERVTLPVRQRQCRHSEKTQNVTHEMYLKNWREGHCQDRPTNANMD